MGNTHTDDLRPELFRPQALSSEAKALIDSVEGKYPILIPRTSAQLKEVRETMRRGANPSKEVTPRAFWRSVPGPQGPVPIRILPAERPRGLLFHVHGGGWCAGAADIQDAMLEPYCVKLELTIASIEYRLAPEHPYPAAPDDCEAVFRWITRNCESEFGTSRLLVLGESSGAHLALVALLRMRNLQGFTDFRGVCLAYGLYDLCGVPSQTRFDHRNLTLNSKLIDWFVAQFVPSQPRREPDVSPLYADLSGLPPVLITVGTHDPLLDHSLFLYVRWVAAGNRADIAVCPGGLHGFLLLEPTPESRRVQGQIERFMLERL